MLLTTCDYLEKSLHPFLDLVTMPENSESVPQRVKSVVQKTQPEVF